MARDAMTTIATIAAVICIPIVISAIVAALTDLSNHASSPLAVFWLPLCLYVACSQHTLHLSWAEEAIAESQVPSSKLPLVTIT
jgi:hypothetical protein